MILKLLLVTEYLLVTILASQILLAGAGCINYFRHYYCYWYFGSSITGTNGAIVLGGNVSGTADTITANGSGTITQTAGTVTGSTSAAFTSGSGAIGSLNIATPNWTANTTGDVTLADTHATTGNGISTGANISFTDSAGG